jgi:hypothetical protein
LIFTKGDTLITTDLKRQELENMALKAFTLLCEKCTIRGISAECNPPARVCERQKNMIRYAKADPTGFLKEWGDKIGKG